MIHYHGLFVPVDVQKSIYYLESASNLNNSYASYLLGMIYMSNYGIEKDVKKSISYLKKASMLENSDAQFQLGVIYYTGKG